MTDGNIHIVDAASSNILWSFKEISGNRVGSLDWKENLLGYGSKSGKIFLKDLRIKEMSQTKFASHT